MSRGSRDNRLRRRTFLNLLGIGAASVPVSLLVACGPQAAPAQQPTAAPAQQPTASAAQPKPQSAPPPTAAAPVAAPAQSSGKIALVHWMWSPDLEFNALVEATKPYVESHPNIDLHMEAFPQDFLPKLVAAMAAGQGPDLFWLYDPSLLRKFQAQNQVLDLQPLITADKFDLGVFNQTIANSYKIAGGFYAFNSGWASTLVAYNKGHFAKAGIPEPTETWTLNDVRETAKKLTIRSGNRVSQYGVAVQLDQNFWPWATANGGGIFDNTDSPTKTLLTDPKTLEIAQFLYDIYNTDHSAPAPDAAKELGSGAGAFQSGQVSMFFPFGMWAPNNVRQNRDVQWDVQHMPLLPSGKRGSLLAGTPMVINAKTAHPQEAYEYLKFHCTAPSINQYIGQNLFGPPVISITKDMYAPPKWNLAPEHMQRFVDALDYSFFPPMWPGWSDFTAQVLNPALDQIASGTTAQTAMEGAQLKGDELIKNFKV